MQEYLPYVVLLGSFLMILSFAIIFLSFFLISQKKEEIEKDGKAVYDIQCGGRFNEKNITVPFLRFTVYKDIIILKTIKSYILPVEKIDRVTVVSGVISKGIRIYHSELSVPAYLIVWNRDAEKLIKIIGEVANKKFIQ